MATIYLTVDDAVALHHAFLAAMGASPRPLLNRGALDAAVHRPRLAAHYENADIARQAAVLVSGVALAHAFEDGNKRAALAIGDVFLQNNNWWVAASDLDFARQIEALITLNESDPDTLWVRAFARDSTPHPRRKS